MNLETPRPTRVLLERRSRALKRHLPAAIAGDGVGVHQARVASRRLREALPVLGVDVATRKARKAERKVQKLTRALGAVRELDVTLAVIDELAAADTLPRAALEQMRAHVSAERDRRRHRMLERLDDVPVHKLERRLAALAGALQTAATEGWRPALGSRLIDRSKGLAAAIARAGQMYNPERLHLVRIAAKKLRYGLEIAAETGVRPAAALVRQLKKAQDALGRLHDLQVLEAHVAAVLARSHRDRAGDADLTEVARRLEEECRHLHSRYVALSPRLLTVIDGTRGLVLAHLVRPGRARRGLQMALVTKRKRRTTDPLSSAADGPRRH